MMSPTTFLNRKRWIRFAFILAPVLILILQMFWRPALQKPDALRRTRALIPPLQLVFLYFDFNEKNALARWEEKVFQGRVTYWIDFEDSSGFVHSKSIRSASALFYRIRFHAKDYPIVSWKWRIGKFPDKSQVQDPKKRDDFAARFYVVFVSRFFTTFRCLEYVWDETLSEGTMLESPYTNQIKQIVIQSGPSEPEKWVPEVQNIYEDYQKAFGRSPKMKVAAIALMTDTEGTLAEAEGFFDDIRIGKGT